MRTYICFKVGVFILVALCRQLIAAPEHICRIGSIALILFFSDLNAVQGLRCIGLVISFCLGDQRVLINRGLCRFFPVLGGLYLLFGKCTRIQDVPLRLREVRISLL